MYVKTNSKVTKPIQNCHYYSKRVGEHDIFQASTHTWNTCQLAVETQERFNSVQIIGSFDGFPRVAEFMDSFRLGPTTLFIQASENFPRSLLSLSRTYVRGVLKIFSASCLFYGYNEAETVARPRVV